MNSKIRVVTLIIISVLVSVIFVSEGFARVYPDLDPKTPKPFIIKGRVTVQFEDNIDLNNTHAMQKSFGRVSFNLPSFDALLDKYQVSSAKPVFDNVQKPKTNSGMYDLTRYYELHFPENIDVNDVVNELSKNPNLRMAEPVWAMPLLATPNDPLWPNQWAMEPPGPDPNFYSAWDYETGADTIKFALIDSGILYNHPDLIGNIWVNPGEDLDGDGVVYDADDFNGVDDDGNGKVDDVIGWDFFTGFGGGLTVAPGEDGGTWDNDPSDFDGHGTHVSGIAAAMTNNGVDVTGIAGGWYGGNRAFRGVQIICCRVGAEASDGLGYINSNDAANGINYAIQMGANVINASWGGSSTTAAAANNAIAAGVNFYHAAGNDNLNSYDNLDLVSGVLSVASVGPSSDVKSDFSNYGAWVDLSAPGSQILSTVSVEYTASTANYWGTSMAAPMVAGLALLIRSQMPSLTRAQVDSIILYSSDFDALYAANPTYLGLLGAGRIDALAALQDLANAKFTADITQGPAPLAVQFTDLSPNSPVSWDWSFGTGDGSFEQNPMYTYLEPGIYDVSLIEDENNPLGPGEEHLKNYIWVTQDTLRVDSIDTPFNNEVVLPVYLENTALVKEIQYVFSYANNMDVSFDSVSVVGTRTDYFESVALTAYDSWNQRISVTLKSNLTGGSNYLQPGGGIMLNLYFTVGNNGNMGVMTIDTTTFNGKSPYIKTIYGDFFPAAYTPGKINVGGCCVGIRGNVDGDASDEINIADIVYFVSYAFGSPNGPAPPCFEEADVDGSGSLDIADIVYLVDYSFGTPNGPAPVPCY